MFIKITKSGQHEYAQLVKSYREKGAVKPKVMLNFGCLDQIKNNPSIKAKVSASAERIREALNAMAFVEMEIEQKKFYVKTKGTELSNKILRALWIKLPKNVTPAEELVL